MARNRAQLDFYYCCSLTAKSGGDRKSYNFTRYRLLTPSQALVSCWNFLAKSSKNTLIKKKSVHLVSLEIELIPSPYWLDFDTSFYAQSHPLMFQKLSMWARELPWWLGVLGSTPQSTTPNFLPKSISSIGQSWGTKIYHKRAMWMVNLQCCVIK